MTYTLSSYHFTLPKELIAQRPCQPRDSSRLMVVDRSKGEISEMRFRDLTDFLQKNDSLIFNDSKVIPARLLGKNPLELLWKCSLQNNKGLTLGKSLPNRKKTYSGSIVRFGEEFSSEILETQEDGSKIVRLTFQGYFWMP